MPKITLPGTVEEQAAQIYDLADEAMQQGRYTGAYHYYQEIERALPGYRDVAARMAQAKRAKREQSNLLIGSILGGALAIALARLAGNNNELIFIGVAILGLLAGFAVTALLFSRRSKPLS